MKYSTFLSIAKKLADTTGRSQRGVRVTFGGDMAYTDGKTINLPAFPPGSVLTKEQERVYMGYIDHESAHVRLTNFKVLEQLKGQDSGLLKHLWNVIEDVRIENGFINIYPGARLNLDSLCEWVDEEGKKKNPSEKGEPLSLIYYHLYKKHREIDTHLHPSGEELADVFPKIQKLLDRRMPLLNNSRDALDLAKEVMALLPEETKQKARDAAQSSKDGHEIRAEMMQDLMGQILQGNFSLELKAAKPGKGKGNPNDTTDYMKLRGGKGGKGSNHTGKSWFPPPTTSYDRVYVPSAQNLYTYQAIRDSAAAEITAAKKMLNIYLRSRAKRAWSRGLEKGRLDTQRLFHLLAADDPRVMKEKRDRPRVNTAVEVLIDLSGSMDTNSTATAAIMIAEAMDGVKDLELEIVGFKSNFGWLQATGAGPYGRMQPMEILIFKGFKQRYKEARPFLGAINCDGGTPLGDAYGYALERILGRDEPKRALWIISDGDPAVGTGHRDHSDYVAMDRLHKKARALGVEVVGLHVGTHSNLGPYVDKMLLVQGKHQFPKVLMDMARGQL